MLPKYPFIIHLSIVSRDVESLQLSPSQGSLLLFVRPKEQRRQLATNCCGCSQRSPPGRWEGACSGGSSIQAAFGSWPRRQHLFLPSSSGLLLCSKTKANNGHLLSPGGDKQKEKHKASFWKLSHWTPCHPKNLTWIHFLPTTGGYCLFL